MLDWFILEIYKGIFFKENKIYLEEKVEFGLFGCEVEFRSW